ncbi:MAG: TAXI family TRAP transporter solute-binding subunit [Actinobacteria bacterium]|nr:TAXI family TRAP transporter solute-binding subunit [Actinomycetota bacterium]
MGQVLACRSRQRHLSDLAEIVYRKEVPVPRLQRRFCLREHRARPPARARRLAFGVSLLSLAFAAACGASPDAESPADEAVEGGTEGSAQTTGDAASIATHAVGLSYHTVGSALASLISNHSDISATVVATAGPNAWMPDLEAGNVDFGLLSVVDVGWSMEGGPGYENPAEHLRTVAQGAALHGSGLTVRADSGIERIEDLAGRRVASDYGGNVISARFVELGLESVGVGWDNVDAVPVADVSTGIDALRNGQVDAISGAAPTSPNLLDAHVATPVRILPVGNHTPADIADGVPSETQEMIDRLIPGATLATQPAGTGMLEEETVLIQHRVQLVSSDHVTADTVYAALDALWENYEEMHDAHPLAQWVPEDMVPSAPRAPYHEGAVQFYEDQGVWTDEHQQAQEELQTATAG